MAARIVFQSRPRGIPSLRRGWRTPDPSPSRDLDEIPAPIMTIIEVESKQGDDDATQGEKTSTWDCATMRAPSQSPEKWDACGQDEVMTPRGHGPNTSAWTPVHWQQAIHEPECAPEAGEQTQKIPPYHLGRRFRHSCCLRCCGGAARSCNAPTESAWVRSVSANLSLLLLQPEQSQICSAANSRGMHCQHIRGVTVIGQLQNDPTIK